VKTRILSAFIIAGLFGYCLMLNSRLAALETIVRYGTIPSSVFPDDPRLQPKHWFNIMSILLEQYRRSDLW